MNKLIDDMRDDENTKFSKPYCHSKFKMSILDAFTEKLLINYMSKNIQVDKILNSKIR